MSLAALDSLGLTFTLAIAVAILALYALHLYLDARRWGRQERERQAEQAEVSGPFADLTAERELRRRRAEFRHASRHSRRAP